MTTPNLTGRKNLPVLKPAWPTPEERKKAEDNEVIREKQKRQQTKK